MTYTLEQFLTVLASKLDDVLFDLGRNHSREIRGGKSRIDHLTLTLTPEGEYQYATLHYGTYV